MATKKKVEAMKLADGSHLSYCTNIHPGETWDQIESNLHRYLPNVKQRVSPAAGFGVGLRLSAAAAETLACPGRRAEFHTWLKREDLYVFTLNGFPYGTFHGQPVKDEVYRPDWRTPERMAYTRRLADILAEWLPEGMAGSISTVPGGYKHHLVSSDDPARIAANLVILAVDLHRLRERTGRCIALALEPEPGCLLETTWESIAFFSEHLFGTTAVAQVGHLAGLGRGEAEALLRRHLGLCLDACHAAVGFEEPATVLSSLRSAGITIHKLQLSAGLRVSKPRQAERAALAVFAEDVYLHQTCANIGGSVKCYDDLPDALADAANADEWRIHYHVPLWADRLEVFATTADWLEELLRLHRHEAVSNHLEVETYTWSVLPERHRNIHVVDAISQELRWVLRRLA
jgi:hypothetical protein